MSGLVYVTSEEYAELQRLVPPMEGMPLDLTTCFFEGVEIRVLPAGVPVPSDEMRARLTEWASSYKPFQPMSWGDLTGGCK